MLPYKIQDTGGNKIKQDMAELCQASALELINMHVGGVIVTLPCQLRALALELNSPSTASPLGKKWSFLNVAKLSLNLNFDFG